MQLLLSYEEIEVDPVSWAGQTPLSVAAEWGWHEIIRMLVPAGANIEHTEVSPAQLTPLKFAAMWGYDDTVQVSWLPLHSPPSLPYHQLFSDSDRSWSRHRPPNWMG